MVIDLTLFFGKKENCLVLTKEEKQQTCNFSLVFSQWLGLQTLFTDVCSKRAVCTLCLIAAGGFKVISVLGQSCVLVPLLQCFCFRPGVCHLWEFIFSYRKVMAASSSPFIYALL